ncbi:MAG: DUF3786 domain-containing protein [Methanomassiliicoccales archaeon]|nr:DUF3786 domain-containing protein [Methanomassiliicoccales archaeon]
MEGDRLVLPHFSSQILVSFKGRTMEEDGKQVRRHLQILVLHYLNGCADAEVGGQDVSFAMLPAGSVYASAFDHRVLRRISAEFGEKPELLLRAGAKLGGVPLRLGNGSVKLMPFPKMPVKVIVWSGDDEIPANASFLFDVNAADILPAEDLSVLAEDTVEHLARAAELN